MSVDGWNTVLVLGGIRSGKSAFAESLVGNAASVRYVATAVGGEDDPEWLERIETHQRRRPQTWTTEETGADPDRLAELLLQAKPDETLLVDDLGGWVAALLNPDRQPNDDQATVAALADAVRDCPARLVVVSPEVGLSLVPVTPLGRAFADALGTANQALAVACDRVVLVVAGQPSWLKPAAGTPAATIDVPASPATAPPAAAPPAATQPESAPPASAPPASAVPAAPLTVADPAADPATAPADVLTGPTMMLPFVSSGIVIQAGMELPLPDHDVGPDAHDRLSTLDLPGTGLGVLDHVVEFAAETQGTPSPRPWRTVRVLVLNGHHTGGAAAGADRQDSDRRAAQIRAGDGPIPQLAAEAGADVLVVQAPESGAMEDGPVLDAETVDAALRQGWQLAEQAADEGVDLLVLGYCGTGGETAAAAVLAAIAGAEPVAVLGRVTVPGGYLDDTAWMSRAAAVRDAMHRIRRSARGAKDILAEIAGGDIAVGTGVLLGAAARRMPVLLDGPVGIAAGLVSRDLAAQTRHWCLLADHGKQPAVRQGADVLGLTPVLDLGLDLGEGANALVALPMLRAVIGLAASLQTHPALGAAPVNTMELDATEVDAAQIDATQLDATELDAAQIDATEFDGREPDDSFVATFGDPEGLDGPQRDDEADDSDDSLAFAEPEPRGPGPATTSGA
jgi:nicotinate-nucleotide--dimethylbenzimidazole phosphoribosyltransferase